MVDVLSFAGLAVVVAGLYWVAYRIEPHHDSKDGSKFLTTAQYFDQRGIPQGRFIEVRGKLIGDGTQIEITRRSGLRRRSAVFRLVAKGPTLSRRRVSYVVQSGDGERLALRLPPASRTAGLLDQSLAAR